MEVENSLQITLLYMIINNTVSPRDCITNGWKNHYLNLMNQKMATQNWKTKNRGYQKNLRVYFKGHNIDCKHHLYAIKKELSKWILNIIKLKKQIGDIGKRVNLCVIFYIVSDIANVFQSPINFVIYWFDCVSKYQYESIQGPFHIKFA